jgi:hypothetical protein
VESHLDHVILCRRFFHIFFVVFVDLTLDGHSVITCPVGRKKIRFGVQKFFDPAALKRDRAGVLAPSDRHMLFLALDRAHPTGAHWRLGKGSPKRRSGVNPRQCEY